MAELPCRPFMTEIEPAADDESSTDAGTERDAQHRAGSSPGAKTMLRQRESARIVDEPGWNLNSIGDLGSNWNSQPVPWDVDDDAGRALLGVVEAGHTHADRPDGALISRRGPGHLDELRQHPVLAVFPVRRDMAARDQARLFATELDHRPLDVRAAHVDAGVKRRHRLHATFTVGANMPPIVPKA
jgi:hypothetical protein